MVVNVGAASTTSDAPIYIAAKKGYFREEGFEAKVTNFRSAADMVAPLGIGQLDAGAGSASAGLYNAMLQGIKIKIVADKASSSPGYGAGKISRYSCVLVSKPAFGPALFLSSASRLSWIRHSSLDLRPGRKRKLNKVWQG